MPPFLLIHLLVYIQVEPVLIVNNPVVNRYSLGFTGFITGSGVPKSYGRYRLSFDEKPP